jgi:trans-L-3-hydroxyproline dehydratase
MHARGLVGAGEPRVFESVTGSHFEGTIVSAFDYGGRSAVTVRVAGRSHWSGRAEYVVEPDDPLGGGFLLR